jgi:outer membrane protein assembly factor BamB
MRYVSDRAAWLLMTLLFGLTAASQAELFIDEVVHIDDEASTGQIYIEDSPAAEQLVEEARHLRLQGRRTEAALKYQQVIEQYAGKLLAVEQGRYIDAARWVGQTLRADAELLEAYRQSHDAIAARALAEALDQRVDRSALAQVFERFALCRSGLEAGLALAGAYLESARPGDAAVVLDALEQHPDLPSNLGRWHLLQAAAGLYGSQPQRSAKHRRALTELGDRQAMAVLDTWSQSAHPPTSAPTIGPTQLAAVKGWPDVPGAATWRLTTKGKGRQGLEATGRVVLRLGNGRRRNAPPAAPALLPVVQGRRLYLNNGASVIAVDRYSGRPLWRYSGTARAAAVQYQRSFPAFFRARAPRAVAIDRGNILAVLGPYGPLRRRMQTSEDASLTCLAHDGRLLWTKRAVELDEKLVRGSFHGTPIADQGRVYIPVRRIQTSRFEGALVLAIQASSGQLLWRRYLSSATPGTAGSAHMLLDDGRLFVADYLGSVACLDSRSGAVLWLTKTAGQHMLGERGRGWNPRGMGMVIRGQSHDARAAGAAPILTAVGLLVLRIGPDNAAWLLDPRSGKKIKALTEKHWTEAEYVLHVTSPVEAVLTVGKSVRLYDGQSLKLIWEHLLPGAPQPSRLAGRPVVTQSRVALPLHTELRLLDLQDGQVVSRLPIGSADPQAEPATAQSGRLGNVLVLEDQLIIAGSTRSSGYVSAARSLTALRTAIVDNDRDSDPGLALAHLALITRDWQVLLEGLDAAIAAFQRSSAAAGAEARPTVGPTGTEGKPSAQRQVFDFIRALVDPDSGAAAGISRQGRIELSGIKSNTELKQQVFLRLAAAAVGPRDIVAYRLALGGFLAQCGKPEDAVDQYQSILSTPAMTRQPIRFKSSSPQAGFEALTRIKALVQIHGPDVYAEYETRAAQRMAELSADAGTTAAPFIALAEQYALASVAPEARAAGAEVLLRQGQLRRAGVQFSRAYAGARTDELRQRVVGQLVTILERGGKLRKARQWLRRVKGQYPQLKLHRNGQSVSFDQWLAELSDADRVEVSLPPFVLPPGKPYVLPGRLLSPTQQHQDTGPTDVILTYDLQTLTLRAGGDLEVRWQLAFSGTDVVLLNLTAEQALFWSEQADTLTAVDARSGERLWEQHDISGTLSRIAGDALTAAQRRFKRMMNPQGLRIRAGRVVADDVVDVQSGVWLAVGEKVICIADGAGRIVAVDRHDGKVLWQYRCGFETLNRMVIGGDSVAVAGQTELPDDSSVGTIVLLDAMTGRTTAPPWQVNDPVGWMGYLDVDLFVYASATSIVALDMPGLDELWRLRLKGRSMSGVGALSDGHLMLHDKGGSLLFIDMGTGALARRLELPITGAARARGLGQRPPAPLSELDLVQADEHWYLLTRRHAESRAGDGRLRWRDAINAAKRSLLLQLVGEQVVAVVAQVDPTLAMRAGDDAAGPDQEKPWYQLFILDRAGGSILAQCDLPTAGMPLERNSAAFLKHRIVLSTAAATIIIPDAQAGSP